MYYEHKTLLVKLKGFNMGPCDAGYYCAISAEGGGATSATYTICPVGHYCEGTFQVQ